MLNRSEMLIVVKVVVLLVWSLNNLMSVCPSPSVFG